MQNVRWFFVLIFYDFFSISKSCICIQFFIISPESISIEIYSCHGDVWKNHSKHLLSCKRNFLIPFSDIFLDSHIRVSSSLFHRITCHSVDSDWHSREIIYPHYIVFFSCASFSLVSIPTARPLAQHICSENPPVYPSTLRTSPAK